MSNRKEEFRIGVVGLAAVLVVGLLITLNKGTSLSFSGAPYVIQIRVDSAPGVGPNTPVRKDGVLIGRVLETSFVPGGGVLIMANLQPGTPIYQSDRCRVQPSSLFGDAVINFSHSGDRVVPVPVPDGSQIQGEALSDPIDAITKLQVEIGPAIESIGRAADGVASLTEKFDSVLGVDFNTNEVEGLITDVRQAAVQFRETMARVSNFTDGVDNVFDGEELKTSISQISQDLPQLLISAQEVVTRATTTLESLDSVVESAETNLNNLQGFTKPLGDRGDELAGMLTESIESLSKSLADIAVFAAALNDSEGTIAQLVSDPALYENINTVIGNTNTVLIQVNDFMKTLRPITADARVFMDKVAREPGRLVGGAVNRGPGIK